MTWLANIHSSMFYNIYRFMVEQVHGDRMEALVKSYRMYLEQVRAFGMEAVLDFTRAYTLIRFFASDMVQLTTCSRCTGQFVAHAYDHKSGYVCVLCSPPSRAGKTGRSRKFTSLVDAESAVLPATPDAGIGAGPTASGQVH